MIDVILTLLIACILVVLIFVFKGLLDIIKSMDPSSSDIKASIERKRDDRIFHLLCIQATIKDVPSDDQEKILKSIEEELIRLGHKEVL